MPVPRTPLGGMFGGGTQPLPPQTLDYGAAIQSLTHGASSLLQNAVLRRVAEQNRQFARQQAAQAQQDRQTQIALAQQREGREAADATARLKVEQDRLDFERNKPAPPRTRYDPNRGVIVDEGTGVATPVQNLPPAPTKEGAAHYDERRGVFVHPDGTVTKVPGLPPPIETPSERRGAAAAVRADASAKRAEDAAALRDKQAEINAARLQLSVDTQGVPRPSKVDAVVLGTDAKGRSAMVPNPARAATVGDSLAYEKSTLQPDRVRLRTATSALAPPAPPTPAPGRLQVPGATGNIDLGTSAPKPRITADQAEYLRTVKKLSDADIRARYSLPGTP